MMKKQNVIKVLAMTLFAGVPLVACANPTGIAITLSSAFSEDTTMDAKIREELNTILEKRITELHDEAVVNDPKAQTGIFSTLGRITSVLYTMRTKKSRLDTEKFVKFLRLLKELLGRSDIPETHKECLRTSAVALRLTTDEMFTKEDCAKLREEINEAITLCECSKEVSQEEPGTLESITMDPKRRG